MELQFAISRGVCGLRSLIVWPPTCVSNWNNFKILPLLAAFQSLSSSNGRTVGAMYLSYICRKVSPCSIFLFSWRRFRHCVIMSWISVTRKSSFTGYSYISIGPDYLFFSLWENYFFQKRVNSFLYFATKRIVDTSICFFMYGNLMLLLWLFGWLEEKHHISL